MTIPEFVAPEWLQGQDAETIHKRMMETLPPDIDDTEGGFPWDFTKPTALEKAELLEFHLIETLKIMHPMWAYGKWLDYHASAVGLTRKPPNAAYGSLSVNGLPGTKIPAGFIFAAPAAGSTPAVEFFAIEDSLIDEEGFASIAVEAVQPGLVGNVQAGTIVIMGSPMMGITSVTNPEKTSGGTEEEDDESLRERIMELNLAAEASFVGCDSDYIRWAREVPGVGTAYVIPQWDPLVPNSVKVVVLDGNGDPANDQIIEAVFQYIISPDNRILRKAPVGALVTVAAPTPVILNFSFSITLHTGVDINDALRRFLSSVKKYYMTAKKNGFVQYNHIHALLTVTEGVYDFDDLTVNGSTENIPLGPDEYPQTGTVTPMDVRTEGSY